MAESPLERLLAVESELRVVMGKEARGVARRAELNLERDLLLDERRRLQVELAEARRLNGTG